AEAAIAAGRAVLVEKPLAAATGDAAAIVEAARRAGVPLMVGHVERWNGAFRALAPRLGRARFVEAHRLASFPGRGLDVDVILDLMIHDLDLVASLAAAPPVRVEAVGVSVLTDTADIANARLEFADGMVANLTASRVSREAVRKMRIFQDDAYLTCDFLRKTAEIYSKRPGAEAMLGVDRRSDGETGGGTAGRSPVPASVVMAAIEHERFGPVETPEPLGAELEAFVEAVATGRPPVPDGAAGLEAVRLAERVTTSMAAAAARMGVATAADGAALPGTPPA
ncbi:MAG: Gfo/Idh/MocA family oxidoreductase, partial [Candidatus Eiseniibacteriota bacterium]